MRTVSESTNVRLYHLDATEAAAHTLLYGSLAEAMAMTRQQPEAIQTGLWLATENDVVAYLELAGNDDF